MLQTSQRSNLFWDGATERRVRQIPESAPSTNDHPEKYVGGVLQRELFVYVLYKKVLDVQQYKTK